MAHSSSITTLPLSLLLQIAKGIRNYEPWEKKTHTQTRRSHSTKSLPAKVVENFSLSHRPSLWSYRYIYTSLAYRFLAKHSHLFRFHTFALLHKWWRRFHSSHCYSFSHSSPPLFTSQVRYLQNSLLFRYFCFSFLLGFRQIFLNFSEVKLKLLFLY